MFTPTHRVDPAIVNEALGVFVASADRKAWHHELALVHIYDFMERRSALAAQSRGPKAAEEMRASWAQAVRDAEAVRTSSKGRAVL